MAKRILVTFDDDTGDAIACIVADENRSESNAVSTLVKEALASRKQREKTK